ncbi:MAG: hypothetical protein KDD62_15820 [Bdellovibrionales bacterium]|nr:hypothetical protein [Bdellovibrionales bacterium]
MKGEKRVGEEMAAYLDYQSVYCRKKKVGYNWSAAFFAGSLLFVILAIKVAFKLQATSLGYDLAQAQKETVELDTERRDAELQRSVLLQPAGLEERAVKSLVLMPYNSAKIIRIPVVQEAF